MCRCCVPYLAIPVGLLPVGTDTVDIDSGARAPGRKAVVVAEADRFVKMLKESAFSPESPDIRDISESRTREGAPLMMSATNASFALHTVNANTLSKYKSDNGLTQSTSSTNYHPAGLIPGALTIGSLSRKQQ